MEKQIKAVVLAAGISTRMKSARSKVVHRILGKEIIRFLLDSLSESGVADRDMILVAGKNLEEMRAVIKRDVCYAVQAQPLGTADALLSAKAYMEGFSGDVLVVVGDNPYITAEELKKLIAAHRSSQADCTLLSAVFPDTPPPYGRIIRDEAGQVLEVVEQLDATPEQRRIREVNASIYLFNNPVVYPLLFKIGNQNAKGEYYLTDIIHLLKNNGNRVDAVKAEDYLISVGINNRWELQEAQQFFNRKRLEKLALDEGVTILQPETVTVEYGVTVGRDTVIYPNTYLASGVHIGAHCEIGPFVFLSNVDIPDNQTIRFEKREG